MARMTRKMNISPKANSPSPFSCKRFSTTAQGITGTSLTEFKNIQKTVPDKSLFELPEGFTKYDTLVQLATGTKAGSRIKKVRERDKKVRRR